MRRSTLRAGALLSAGALSLHELRYLVAWGSGAGQALAEQGHGYLSYVIPLAVGLVAVGLAQVLLCVGGVPGRERPSRGWVSAWLGASVALLAIYVAQETAEGLLYSGHRGGAAGVFGNGGLVVVPLALALGGLIVIAERRACVAAVAPSRLGLAGVAAGWPAPVGARPAAPLPARAPASELALHLAGRAPPPLLR